MRSVSAAIAALIVGSVLVPVQAANATYNEECTDYFFIGARGTNAAPQGEETYNSGNFDGMGPEAHEALLALETAITDSDLTNKSWGLRYPATPDIFNEMLSGTNNSPDATSYQLSIDAGGAAFQEKVEDVLAACPDIQFLLVGYSQGADAIAEGVSLLTSTEKAHIAGSIFLGDPKFNPTDVDSIRGTFDPQHRGLFGKRPLWSTVLDSPVFSYCRHADAACNSVQLHENFLGGHTKDLVFILGHNPLLAPVHEHEQYLPSHQGRRAAWSLAQALGLSCAQATPGFDAHLSGPSTVHVGDPTVFSAVGSADSDCDQLDWFWQLHHGVSDAIVGNATLMAADGSVLRSMDDPVEDPPLSTDPYLSYVFDEPGTYTISVDVGDGEESDGAQAVVTVLAADTVAPGAPLVTTSAPEADELLISWSPSGAPADNYAIKDANGDIVDSVVPVLELGLDGMENYEYLITDLDESDSREYSIVAMNDIGETAGILAMPAVTASIDHRTWNGASPGGGTLSLSGSMTFPVDLLVGDDPDPISLTGDYEAEVQTGDGTIGFDMSAVVGEFAVDDGDWTATVDYGDVLDTEGGSVASQLREGLADSLLSGGVVVIELDGTRLALVVDEATTSIQEHQYVINTDATVPDGVEADEYYGSASAGVVEVVHHGPYDDELVPAWNEAIDPETVDWGAAEFSDVHVFANGQELRLAGNLQLYQVLDPDGVDDYSIDLAIWGQVGDGSYLTMRSFLTDGAVSFKVNGGAPNALTLDADSGLAEELFPEPGPPVFLDETHLQAVTGEWFNWSPWVDWSVDGSGSLNLEAEDLPSGITLSWDGLSGTPSEPGTYVIAATATNTLGETSEEFALEVLSSDLPVSDATYVHHTVSEETTADGVLSIGGDVTDYLAQLAAEEIPQLDGSYDAVFTPTAGTPFSWDVSEADLDFDIVDDTWTATLDFGDDLNTNSGVIWETMRSGEAAELLAGSRIDFQLDGHWVHFVIDGSTEIDEINRYVLGDADQPDGVVTDLALGLLQWQMVEYSHDGPYDPLELPLSTEVDLETYDFSAAVISDVQFYIGDQKVVSDATVHINGVLEPLSTEDGSISLTINGAIGDGRHMTYQSFLQDGAVSFRVDGGSANVVSWRTSQVDAENVFPAPSLPSLVYLSIPTELPQFDDVFWTPLIDWGGAVGGTYNIQVDSMPVGLSIGWSGPNQAKFLSGFARYQDDFTITLTATNYMGTMSQDIDIDVVPSLAHEHLWLSPGNIWRNSNGTLRFRFVGINQHVYAENATMAALFPAVEEAGLGLDVADSETFTATDVHLFAGEDEVDFTGTLTVNVYSSSINGNGGWLINSSDMTIEDNSTETVEGFFQNDFTLTFRRGEAKSTPSSRKVPARGGPSSPPRPTCEQGELPVPQARACPGRSGHN